jgi:hypothetical protein
MSEAEIAITPKAITFFFNINSPLKASREVGPLIESRGSIQQIEESLDNELESLFTVN